MTPDAIHAIASKVEREWGHYGYRFEAITGLGWTGGAVGHVCASDGARFVVVSDRYGNTAHGDDEAQAVAALAAVSVAHRVESA